MSQVAAILDQVLKDEGEAAGRLTIAWVQRRASRRLFQDAANRFRHCADRLDQAALLLAPSGDPTP